jgi:hypothetical protein
LHRAWVIRESCASWGEPWNVLWYTHSHPR